MEFIDLKSQYIKMKQDIDRSIQGVLDHGKYIMGPEVAECEQQLSEFTQSNYCITVSSGTEALLISLMAIGIKPGDEVITTPFTFISTAEVIVLLGAIPIFVDVEEDTANINVSLVEEKISAKTKAIIPVSLYGQPSDMDELMSIAEKHGIVVIEDAAQSFGAEYKGRKSCNLSHIGCTSFFPSKPLGCYGDGGAIFTNNEDYASVIRRIRIHGQSERYVHTEVGVGGRMDTIQCAVVLSKLANFKEEIDKRLLIGDRYNSLLSGKVKTIAQRRDRTSVFGQYTVVLDNRSAVIDKLKAHGVPTAVHYPVPVNRQSAYKKFSNDGESPVADKLSQQVMSLPMHPYLTESDIEKVSSVLLEAIK